MEIEQSGTSSIVIPHLPPLTHLSPLRLEMADFPSDPSSVMLLKERSSQVSEIMLSMVTELVVENVNKPDDNLVLLKVSQNLPQARE